MKAYHLGLLVPLSAIKRTWNNKELEKRSKYIDTNNLLTGILAKILGRQLKTPNSRKTGTKPR
ncbi:hypothetical protein Hanom_Chr15g01380541 [Helianthus anomalus]